MILLADAARESLTLRTKGNVLSAPALECALGRKRHTFTVKLVPTVVSTESGDCR